MDVIIVTRFCYFMSHLTYGSLVALSCKYYLRSPIQRLSMLSVAIYSVIGYKHLVKLSYHTISIFFHGSDRDSERPCHWIILRVR